MKKLLAFLLSVVDVSAFFFFGESPVLYRQSSIRAGFPLELKPTVEYGWLHLLGEAVGALVILFVLYVLLSCLNILFGSPNPLLDWPWQAVLWLGHEVGLF